MEYNGINLNRDRDRFDSLVKKYSLKSMDEWSNPPFKPTEEESDFMRTYYLMEEFQAYGEV